jgi:hypothetical protein
MTLQLWTNENFSLSVDLYIAAYIIDRQTDKWWIVDIYLPAWRVVEDIFHSILLFSRLSNRGAPVRVPPFARISPDVSWKLCRMIKRYSFLMYLPVICRAE